MNKPPANIPPELNADWLALRQKHQKESTDFQHYVGKEKAEFDRRAEVARQRLLAKHIGEEQQFWSRHGQTPNLTKDSATTNRMKTPRTATPAKSAATPLAKAAGPSSAAPKMQKQAGSSRASQPTKPASATPVSEKPRPKARPAQKRGVVEVIDLCSSDEEDDQPVEDATARKPSQAPGQRATASSPIWAPQSSGAPPGEGAAVQTIPTFSIPSASIELFGGNSNKYQLYDPQQTRLKREDCRANTPNSSNPFASPSFGYNPIASIPRNVANAYSHTDRVGFGFNPPSSFAQRASSTAPRASPFTFQSTPAPSTPRARQPLLPDKSPELPLNSLRQQQQDRSAILKVPDTLRRNATLFALEQKRQNGAFVNDILQNERSRSLAPELGKVLKRSEDGVMGGTAMQQEQSGGGVEASNFTGRGVAALEETVWLAEKGTVAANSKDAVAEHGTRQERGRCIGLPSPSPSHASLASEPVTPKAPIVTATSHVFKIPTTPASAGQPFLSRQSAAPEARNVRANTIGSRASLTLPVTPRSDRDDLVTSPTSDHTTRTGASATRKRPLSVALSSDEDEVSDYEPSSPDSPLAHKAKKEVRVNLGVKKAKVTHGQGSVAKGPSSVMNTAGKNFGLKPRPVVDRAPSMTPATSGRASGAKFPALTIPKTRSRPAINDKVAATPESVPVRAASKQPLPKPTSMRPPPSKKPKPLPQPSKRRAALAAESRIADIYEFEEEVRTEFAIDDADAMEEAEPVREQNLKNGMRGLSITPAPSNHRVVDDMDGVQHLVESEGPSEGAQADDMLVTVEDIKADIAAMAANSKDTVAEHGTRQKRQSPPYIPSASQESTNNDIYTRSQYLSDRDLGDRNFTNPNTRTVVSSRANEQDDDLDISEYIYINGVIWNTSEIEELDLTRDTQTMTSSATAVGGPGPERGVEGALGTGGGDDRKDDSGKGEMGMGVWKKSSGWSGCATS